MNADPRVKLSQELTAASAAPALEALDRDAALPPNPWGADSLQELYSNLSAIRPAPAASPAGTLLVDVGQPRADTGCRANLRIGGDTWTAETTRDGDLQSDTTRGRVPDDQGAP